MRLRLAVVLALVLGFSSSAFAQLMPTYGVKGGVGFGSLSSDDEFVKENLDGMRTGLIIGGTVGFPVSSMLNMVIDVLYNQKGAKGDFTEDGISGDVTARVDYIQIPILGEFNFQTMSSVMPFINFGVAPAFKTSASLKAKANGEEFEETDFKDNAESFDLGLIIGGGVKSGNFGAEVRYDLGLLNIVKEALTSDSIKTRQFAILGSWFF